MSVRGLKSAPVLVVAGAALVVGLAMPAAAREAGHMISGSSITKHSIAGNRLKNNTITGRQIKESTLATVRRASHAKTAGSAPLLPVAAVGQTEHGAWNLDMAPGITVDTATFSFPVPMPHSLTVRIVDDSQSTVSPPHGCAGNEFAPRAAPGYLCVFVGTSDNIGSNGGESYYPYDPNSAASSDVTSPYGELIQAFAADGTEFAYASGTWAATAGSSNPSLMTRGARR